jgi:hypothetical protein
VWNHSVFSKNRDRLIEHDAVTELFNATVETARKKGLLSGEHFSVDGTLIQAWASHKSMRRKDGSDEGRPPDNCTARNEATTRTSPRRIPSSALPQEPCRAGAAELSRACADGQPARPAVNVQASQSDGFAEREVAAAMLADVAQPGKRITVGADKGYDTRGFKACRDTNITDVAEGTRGGGSAVYGERHGTRGYAINQPEEWHRTALRLGQVDRTDAPW